MKVPWEPLGVQGVEIMIAIHSGKGKIRMIGPRGMAEVEEKVRTEIEGMTVVERGEIILIDTRVMTPI